MISRVVLIILVVLQVADVSATPQDGYDKFKQQYQQQYKTFKTAYQKRYDAFKSRVTGEWGDQAQVSDADTYVEYSDDLQQRTVVDFENQTIVVERLDEQPIDVNFAEQVLQKLQQSSVSETAKKDPILQADEVDNSSSLLEAWAPGISVTDILNAAAVKVSETIATVTEEVQTRVAQAKPTAQPLKQPPQRKKVQQLTVKLSDDSIIGKRAKPFVPRATEMAKELDLPLNLVMAIIEVESSFNPLAQSPIPAFGLMQVVPTSAGTDVNQMILKRKGAPKTSVLLNPEENIRFGTNYLVILRDRYLDSIDDPTSRLYCVIAAYNTGAGNVAKTFHPYGRTRVSEAAKIINKMTPEQVYQKLERDLPYEETRNYIRKVRSAMQRYAI